MNYKPTNSDIDTLRNFNVHFTNEILKKLPGDSGFSRNDIESEINYQFYGYLLPRFNGNGSFCSYCYKYGGKIAFRKLMNEYLRMSKQGQLLEELIEEQKNDDDRISHQHGTYEIEPYMPIAEHIEVTDDVRCLLAKMNKVDQMIAKMIIEGRSYDDIANEVGMTKQACIKRMKKYGKQ